MRDILCHQTKNKTPYGRPGHYAYPIQSAFLSLRFTINPGQKSQEAFISNPSTSCIKLNSKNRTKRPHMWLCASESASFCVCIQLDTNQNQLPLSGHAHLPSPPTLLSPPGRSPEPRAAYRLSNASLTKDKKRAELKSCSLPAPCLRTFSILFVEIPWANKIPFCHNGKVKVPVCQNRKKKVLNFEFLFAFGTQFEPDADPNLNGNPYPYPKTANFIAFLYLYLLLPSLAVQRIRFSAQVLQPPIRHSTPHHPPPSGIGALKSKQRVGLFLFFFWVDCVWGNWRIVCSAQCRRFV